MVHYKDTEHPTACIFGTKLQGDLNKATILNEFVRIISFKCEVKEPSTNCENGVKDYGHLKPLDGNLGSSMSGRRGIVEPSSGYNGVGLITKKKPKKVTTHNSLFLVSGSPAVCYFDTLEIQERKIKLSSVELSGK